MRGAATSGSTSSCWPGWPSWSSPTPCSRRDLPLRLASGWGRDEDRIRYVRRSVTAGDDSAAVTFDAVKDRLFFLRRSGTLDRLLALFGERPELRHHELADWLAAEHGAAPAECEAYVGALLQLGMVRVPCLDTEVHDGDPLRAFQRSLTALDRPWAHTLAELLDRPAAVLERYPAAGQGERAELLRALRAGLRAAQEELGERTAALPQTLLYEDVSAGTDVSAAAPPGRRPGAARCARSSGSSRPSTSRSPSGSPSRASSPPVTARAAAARTCWAWCTTSTRTSSTSTCRSRPAARPSTRAGSTCPRRTGSACRASAPLTRRGAASSA